MTSVGPVGPARAGAARSWTVGTHRLLERVEQAVGAVLVTFLGVLVLLQVAQRYLPVETWVWTGELARYCLVWLTFLLAGHLTGRGDHIALEIADYALRGRALTVVIRGADALVAIIAVGFTVDAANLIVTSTGRSSPAMGIPLAWLYVAVLAGFAATALRAGWAAVVGRPARSPEPDERTLR